jgi:hyaluronoglucosaminidase
VAEDGAIAYFANAEANTVTGVRLSDGSAVAEISVAKTPIDVVVAPGGRRSFTADRQADVVSVIDTATPAG